MVDETGASDALDDFVNAGSEEDDSLEIYERTLLIYR